MKGRDVHFTMLWFPARQALTNGRVTPCGATWIYLRLQCYHYPTYACVPWDANTLSSNILLWLMVGHGHRSKKSINKLFIDHMSSDCVQDFWRPWNAMPCLLCNFKFFFSLNYSAQWVYPNAHHKDYLELWDKEILMPNQSQPTDCRF